MLVLSFLFWANILSAQQPSPTLSANFRNTDLRAALDFFEKNSGISFSYDDEALKGVRVTVQFQALPLREAMKRTLSGTGLGCEVIDQKYVLIKKLDTSQSSSSPLKSREIGTGSETLKPEILKPIPSLALCGTILDAETNEPLPGATAHIKDTPHGTATDADGKFKLEGDFSKDDSLIISYLGYRQQAFVVRPLLVKPCQTYRLKYDAVNMPDVIISEFATDMIRLSESGSYKFDRKKMPTLPGWGEPDVLRSLQLLPGIGSADESGSRLNVRGGTPDQNLVMLDGIPVYHTGHFFGLYDSFNPFVVDQVEVWRGNFGAEYGGRNSSVIDISSKKDFPSKTRWGIGMNLLSTQAYVDIPLKKERIALLIAFRRSYIDGLQATAYQNFFKQLFQNGRVDFGQQATAQDQRYTWNPFLNFGDANIKLRWRTRKAAENALTLFVSGDHLDYHFEKNDSTDYFKTDDVMDTQNTGLSWMHKANWSPKFKVRYHASLSGFSNTYAFLWNATDPNRDFAYRLNRDNRMTEFRSNFHHDWQRNERQRLSFGYQYNAQEAVLAYSDTNAVELTSHILWNDTVRSAQHTFYAEFGYQATDRLNISLGLRGTLFPARGLNYTEPRISFNWYPWGKQQAGSWQVKGGVGRYWQFVFQMLDFNELGIGEPLWALASENTPAQELWQYTLGIGKETSNTLLDLEVYWKRNRNLTTANLLLESSFGTNFFDGESKAAGLDVLWRKRWAKYSLWLSYSLSKVELRFPELNLGLPYPARHDIRSRINFVNTYTLRKWEFSANLHLRSGIPYSPTPSIFETPCASCPDGIERRLYFERLNTNRLEGLARLDLSVTWKWQKRRNNGKLGIAIYNFTNRQNILDKDYLLQSPPDDQSPYTVKELSRIAARSTPSFFVISQW